MLAAFTLLCACATRPGVQRLSPSSLGCLRAVVREKLPQPLPDKQAHCLAAGLIVRYCSRAEAYLAGYGKEFTDIFDGGDPEIGDIKADLIGIRCATSAHTTSDLAGCCATELTRRHLPWKSVTLAP
ncbi:MAG: hypothetical protein WDM77_03280 [Steroidobacteraceae bacterium]